MQNPEYPRERAANSYDEFLKTCWVFIALLATILQTMYQPFETHYPKAVAFVVSILIHFVTLLADFGFRTYGINRAVVIKLSLFTGVLTVILPILIIVPVIGWLALSIYASLSGIVICRWYVEIRRDFVNTFEELMNTFGNGNTNEQPPDGMLVENQHEHPELPV